MMLLAGSCRKSKADVIPEVYVEFTINLLDPEFIDLGFPGNHKLVDANTNNWGIRSAGFDGNGIIVYCAQMDDFYAFDRTCPHDYATTSTSVAVNIEPGELFATCPECGSVYALPSFGSPTDGPSKYPLKSYKTNLVGEYLSVFN